MTHENRNLLGRGRLLVVSEVSVHSFQMD